MDEDPPLQTQNFLIENGLAKPENPFKAEFYSRPEEGELQPTLNWERSSPINNNTVYNMMSRRRGFPLEEDIFLAQMSCKGSSYTY